MIIERQNEVIMHPIQSIVNSGSSEGLTKEEKKNKKRQKYKGNPELMIEIPADPEEDIFDSAVHKRVAIYARVSTDSTEQTSSYELQKNYYEDMVNNHPNWELVDIYADEGISGTSLRHRDEFIRMIKDCREGKIDLIITKMVSRFARNEEDLQHYKKLLKKLHPPVGILFETERLYTLNENSDMQLSFLGTMAQEESHTKSVSMNRSLQMRFKQGILLTPVLLGYDHDEDGELIINREEAKTVELIFKMCLAGKENSEIAMELKNLGRKTKKGNAEWAHSSINGILRNERYCGDVLAWKTYTEDYLEHKSVKNTGKRPQYYRKDHHEAIVTRDEYLEVQRILDAAKYGFRSALPELKVIDQGALRGFVQINPLWRGFTESDYLVACHSTLTDEDYLNPGIMIKRKKGDFDFGSFEVVRSQYVTETKKISVNISSTHIRFSNTAIKEMDEDSYVELLYHPLYQIIVLRKTDRHNRHGIKWIAYHGNTPRSRKVNGAAFLGILYGLTGWNPEYRYELDGYIKKQENEKVLIFFVDEPLIRVKDENTGRLREAYPSEWQGKVGTPYYQQKAKEVSVFRDGMKWKSYQQGIIARSEGFHTGDRSRYEAEYKELISEMANEKKDGGY